MKRTTARSRVALERPQLKVEWYSVASAADLQMPYDVLAHIRTLNHGAGDGTPNGPRVAISVFLSLTEILVEKCPPFRGGQQWDNRK